jgi:ribonuclease VapC
MIVIDGSALFAILLAEAEAPRCRAAIESADELYMSAGSLMECLIVASRKDVYDEMRNFIAALDLRIIPVTENLARAGVEGYRKWGKGFHPAKLNMGDSFAYILARDLDCPLLFVGNDFALTDVEVA